MNLKRILFERAYQVEQCYQQSSSGSSQEQEWERAHRALSGIISEAGLYEEYVEYKRGVRRSDFFATLILIGVIVVAFLFL